MDLSTLTANKLCFETKRLNIRLMTSSDFEYFSQLQSDPELMVYIGSSDDKEALKDKFTQRANCLNDHSQWFTFLVFDKATTTFCGSVGFQLQDIENQRVEIGYIALAQMQGKGFITEAALELVKFIFSQLNAKKVVANCAIGNTASWKVMEKLELVREGTLKCDFQVNGVWHDSYCYGLVNPAHF